MAESKEYMTLPEENGSINIAEEVIAAIAVGAVRDVEGVSGMMTSMGNSEFVLTIFGALAQEESANTSKRVKFGKKMNAENSSWHAVRGKLLPHSRLPKIC